MPLRIFNVSRALEWEIQEACYLGNALGVSLLFLRIVKQKMTCNVIAPELKNFTVFVFVWLEYFHSRGILGHTEPTLDLLAIVVLAKVVHPF